MATRRDTSIPIAFCLDNLGTGGTELNAVRLAERLDGHKYPLHLITLQANGPLLDRFLLAGVTHHHLPIRNLWGAGAWRAGWALRTLLTEQRIQILHAHDLYTSILLVPWARTARPRVATIASRRWWQPPSPRLGFLGRLTAPLADRLLVNSLALARRTVATEGVQADRVVVVPNFLDDDAIRERTETERHEARRGVGIDIDAVVMGIVARLDPVKDHLTLFQAFAQAARGFPQAHLLVVGDGPERERLEAAVTGLGLHGRVTFAGHQSNAANLHVACDITVLCSKHEGFPNSLVEGMGAARPVIATAVGGNLDAVRPGETGLLVPVGSVAGLAEAMGSLLADPLERRRMGLAGLAVARAEYSASVALGRLEALYAELRPVADGAIKG